MATWTHVTDNDLARIRALHAQGKNDVQIAKAMGRGKNTIWTHRNRMGLTPNRVPSSQTNWSPAAVAKRRATTEARFGVKSGAAILQMKYALRAAHLGWPGRPLAQASILHALERLESATVQQVCDFAVLDRQARGWSQGLSRGSFSTAFGRIRADGLAISTRSVRTGKPGGQIALYKLTPKARIWIDRRNRRGPRPTV